MVNVSWRDSPGYQARVHLTARSGVTFSEYLDHREQSFKVFTSVDSLPEWIRTKMLLLDMACNGGDKEAFLPSVGLLFPKANIYHIYGGTNDN